MTQVLERITSFAGRRPRLTLLGVAGVAVACAVIALGLKPSSNINTFVSSSTPDSRATQVDAHQFGGDAVVVLVRDPVKTLVGTHDLVALSELEACLGGQEVTESKQLGAYQPVAASRATPYGGTRSPCGQLMASQPADIVYGPATFLNQAVGAVNQEITALKASAQATIKQAEEKALAIARGKGLSVAQQKQLVTAAGEIESQQQETKLISLAQSSGLLSVVEQGLSIANAAFIDRIVFGSSSDSAPKTRFNYLFPSADSALIQVRLKPGLNTAQTTRAIQEISAATQMKQFALGSGGSYLVSGEPVVLNSVSATLSGQVARLLVGAVVVMGIVLVFVFRRRRRLLPLALALAAVAITFGLCAIAGGTLTIASIAVLPVLIGLAVDYGIQFQSRASGATTIAAAALATATGFLVLLLSPVPMVRGFGLLLVLGVGVAFVVVLTAGSAALVLNGFGVALPAPVSASLRGARDLMSPLWATLASRRATIAPLRATLAPLRATPAAAALSARELLVASLRGAGEILGLAGAARRGPGPITPGPEVAGGAGASGAAAGLDRTLGRLSRRPRSVIALGLALAVIGWVVDTQTSVQSDVTKLVPKNLPALQNLNTLERTTGQSGELDVIVHGKSVATPATVAWMVRYEAQIVRHFGYTDATGCTGGATVCPALSLPDLFTSSTNSSSSAGSAAAGSSTAAAAKLTQSQINTLLGAVPTYFSQAVINPARTYASLSFGIRLMPLSKQIRVVAYMRNHLHPPAGITARLAGLPVLAADADASLSSSGRRLVTLVAGLLAVALMLLLVFRDLRRAIIPVVPIVLATGWSALIVWAIGIPLNPMSATLGALVIAISTEFSVLLAERFRRQRADGEAPDTALANAYRSTGKAVLASGITAIAGFAVLIVSNVTMLRDFGLVTLIDMTVSLLGVLAVLPAVLTLSESGAQLSASASRLGLGRRGPRRTPSRLRRRVTA